MIMSVEGFQFHISVAVRDRFVWLCGHIQVKRASLMAHLVKNLPTMWEPWVLSLGQEDPWGRKWQPAPVLLPGKSHGWRSLVGYSPWNRKESDVTSDFTSLHFPFPEHSLAS